MIARPRGLAEAWFVGAGALLLVGTGLVPAGAAARAIGRGLDVYTFLAGMMLLAELGRESGVFDWLAATVVRRAGRADRLFALVYGLGVIVTTFLSNDATAVVLTPAILVAVKKAKIDPRPHLYVCALVANAASFVLPISNPANLVVFHGAMPALGAWLLAFALPSLAAIGVTFLVLRVLFREALAAPLAPVPAAALAPEGRRVLLGLALTSLALLVASALRRDLGPPTLVAAVLVTLGTGFSPLRLGRRISAPTLLLVAALFVFVAAVEEIGAVATTSAWLARLATWPRPLAMLTAAFVVGVGNDVVNNLPLGLLTGATIGAAHPPAPIVHALLLGVDLGPNLATTGSLATLLWLIALRREGVKVGFFEFLRIGLATMPPALAAATLAAYLVSLLTGS